MRFIVTFCKCLRKRLLIQIFKKWKSRQAEHFPIVFFLFLSKIEILTWREMWKNWWVTLHNVLMRFSKLIRSHEMRKTVWSSPSGHTHSPATIFTTFQKSPENHQNRQKRVIFYQFWPFIWKCGITICLERFRGRVLHD